MPRDNEEIRRTNAPIFNPHVVRGRCLNEEIIYDRL